MFCEAQVKSKFFAWTVTKINTNHSSVRNIVAKVNLQLLLELIETVNQCRDELPVEQMNTTEYIGCTTKV